MSRVQRCYQAPCININFLSESGTLRFNFELDEMALQALIKNGLRDRFPDDCTFWVKHKHEALQSLQIDINSEEAKIEARLKAESRQLQAILHEAIVDVVISVFPCVAFRFLKPSLTFPQNVYSAVFRFRGRGG